MPVRARNDAFWLTTTSTATPISSSGSTSKTLFATEYVLASAMSRRCGRAKPASRRSGEGADMVDPGAAARFAAGVQCPTGVHSADAHRLQQAVRRALPVHRLGRSAPADA